MTRVTRRASILVALVAITGALRAQVPPERLPAVADKAYRHTDLTIPAFNDPIHHLPPRAAAQARRRLARLGVHEATARVDRRSGRFVTLMPTEPMVPGKGVGNELRWADLKMAAPQDRAGREKAAGDAFLAYLDVHHADLGIDPGELTPLRVVSHGDDLYQIYAGRTSDGIPVRDSSLNAVIAQGNLTLLGAHRWGDLGASSNRPWLSSEEARDAATSYLAPLAVTGEWGKTELVYVPTARGQAPTGVGDGYTYRLVGSVKLRVEGDAGHWELLVDAHTGEVLSSQDTNQYAEVKGGVYPVTNDGIVPDGVEQAGWPMPYQDTTLGTTDTGGNVPGGGTITATFYGTYVDVFDNCGTDSLTQNDNVDWGTSAGTDCATPGFGGAGNTHASRTGFYELNKVIEMARGQLPSSSWLQSRLASNMNINNTCNAYWNGTVNFYRSGGGCSNTGEIAGVFDHEWGHGMDQNDATPGIASPSGEGIADIYTALRLNTSCIGRNFRPGIQCGGFGDPCTECTGVRDIDYMKHLSEQPHTYSWSNANCGGSVHCVGGVYSEAVWSLWKRELQGAPYNYDNNTAHEIVTRLTFIGAGATGTWFSGGPPNGGCGGSSGYMNYLAADDDDGNLGNGTPHMTAIYAAFNDQEIACQTPSPTDSGCAGVPTTAPSVTPTASDKSVDLSWGAVTGATSYEVFRTEGVFACDFGKVKLGSTTGTTWNDTGLQNGRTYSYVVIAKSGASCFGPASSCTNATPAAGPDLTINTGSESTSISGGDGDAYLDNCEDGTTTFTVTNTGLGTLTNARITSVTPSNPGVVVNTSLPAAILPSTLAQGADGTGSFSYTAGGLSAGEVLTFTVSVTADEMAAPKTSDLSAGTTETDLTFTASQTYTFEAGAEGWTTLQGTFSRASAGGGAGGSTWYEQSSAYLDNQCDQVQSPVMVLSETSTLTLWTNYDIEPQYTNGEWYDRANVGIVDVATGVRTLVSPDGDRLYNATGVNGTCGTNGQDGWAGGETEAGSGWGISSYSSSALFDLPPQPPSFAAGQAVQAGEPVQIDIRYGTDAAINGYGFRFDNVTVTDVYFQGADTQGDACTGCVVDADCDNGLYCDGAETCVAGSCQPGTPVVCDDGVACTDDSCNEGTDQCDNVANDANCDDGLFCDGAETCDPVLDCQTGSDPCPGQLCDEAGDVCYECNVNADCDDGLFCNGAETCNAGSCQAGSDPCGGAACDEVNDECLVCSPKGASCTLDSDCCGNKCRGKVGSKTCK